MPRIQVCVVIVLICSANAYAAKPGKNLSVPDGFEVTLFADDNLAHDVYSMTVDARGRVVVSGRGYVKILVDRNGDGRADEAKLFVNGPRTGAQGMYFDGNDLLCVGDAGLIRYRDADGDDRADGPPRTLLKVHAGGEHHAHAIQRGPDGCWYLVAGNHAGIQKSTISNPHSPILNPRFGTLVRMSRDFKRREVVADGYRNAYDFAFHWLGDVFVYDSDGERDVSLPWYRPTRVFHAIPGANAGWFDRSWKRPNHYFEMQPVIGEFGRGSPTGVACYRHTQFPKPYRDAIYALDWTYGRVLMMPLETGGSVWKSRPKVFMKGVNNFGFAPTDVAVGPSGELYVSVGGRGTRGGVYRVRYRGPVSAQTKQTRLTACLHAPQPLASWSRKRWLPLARQIGAAGFQTVISDARRSVKARVRAVEIVTELFSGIDANQLGKIAIIKSPEVKARMAWSIGRRAKFGQAEKAALRRLLADSSPVVQRFALESLIGRESRANVVLDAPTLSKLLSSAHRFIRAQAARLAGKTTGESQKKLLRQIKDNPIARLSYWLGFYDRKETKKLDPEFVYAFAAGYNIAFDVDQLLVHRLAGTRLMQLALGDVGPGTDGGKDGPVFLGYGRRVGSFQQIPDMANQVAAKLHKSIPTGSKVLDREMSRLLAMLRPTKPTWAGCLIDQLNNKSHPVDDIHNLIVLARLQARGKENRAAIAKALVGLEDKIAARKLYQDNNWEPRVREITRRLITADSKLPEAMVAERRFGSSGHLLFSTMFKRELRAKAIDKMVTRIRQTGEDYVWTNAMIYELAHWGKSPHLKLVRSQFENFSVRNAVLHVLTRDPQAIDRKRFIAGLGSSQVRIVQACSSSLLQLKSAKADGDMLAALLMGLRRLGGERNEVAARDQIVKLLRRETKQSFGYKFKQFAPQSSVVGRWTTWLSKTCPQQMAAVLVAAGKSHEKFAKRLKSVPWAAGDAIRGKQLYIRRSCKQCHGGRRSLGPDLRGVAQRFNRRDLFTAIRFPSRDVSPRYQTTIIQLETGKSMTGLVIYESIDGLILRNGTNQTFRIESRNIEHRQKLRTSLMPADLLHGLKPSDWADLYAYLRGLKR